jgi:hypothetical protein
MILDQVPAVQKLSAEEKWQLIDELWQQLLPPAIPEPQAEIVHLLESRLAEYRDMLIHLMQVLIKPEAKRGLCWKRCPRAFGIQRAEFCGG